MDAKEVLFHLRAMPLFRGLTEPAAEQELYRIVPYVREHEYAAGDTILSAEHPPDRLCYIVTGEVNLESPVAEGVASVAKRIGPGAAFGRVSLAVGDAARISAEAAEPTRVLFLLLRDLVRIYEKSEYLRAQLAGPLQPRALVRALQAIPLFEACRDTRGELELYRVAELVHDQVYGNGEWLFRQGELSDRLVQIVEGRVRLTQVDREGVARTVGWLEPGDAAGETGLLVGDFHDVTATAEGHARVLYLLREELSPLLEDRPQLKRRLQVSPSVAHRLTFPYFGWLRDDEWAVAVVQRHWSRLARQIIAPLLLMTALVVGAIWLTVMGGGFSVAVALLFGAVSVVLLGLVVWDYINWRDDFFVVTTQRVVHVERTGPLSTEQEENSLDNIQDIFEARAGAMAALLNYGNLVLQTAGDAVQVDMDYMPDPGGLRELIFAQIDRLGARNLLRMRGQIRELLSTRLRTDETEQPREEQPPAARRDRGPLPLAVLRGFWEYLFPPSWQEVGDGGTLVLRRYWLPGLLRYSAALIPFLALSIGGVAYLVTQVIRANASLGAGFVVWLIAEIILLAVLLYLIEDWRNDYVELTQTHVVLVQRRPLLIQESRRQARLDRIQNLSYEVPSLAARVLNYGNVQFETAGREGKFELKWVRRPADIQKAISDRQYNYAQHLQEVEAARRQEELLSWFSTYHSLREDL